MYSKVLFEINSDDVTFVPGKYRESKSNAGFKDLNVSIYNLPILESELQVFLVIYKDKSVILNQSKVYVRKVYLGQTKHFPLVNLKKKHSSFLQ